MSLNDRLSTLRRMMPSLKKQYEQGKRQHSISGNGALHPPCLICGKRFGSQINPKPKNHCPECEKRLANGECCITSMEGAVYMWATIDDAADEALKANRGKVIQVSTAEMAEIQKRFGGKESEI